MKTYSYYLYKLFQSRDIRTTIKNNDQSGGNKNY